MMLHRNADDAERRWQRGGSGGGGFRLAGAVGNSEGTAVRGTLGNWRLEMFCPLAL